MLDIKFVRENPELVKAAITKKHLAELDVDRVLELDQQRRQLLQKIESDRAEQRKKSKEIGALPPEERAAASARMKELKAGLKAGEDELRAVEQQLHELMLRLPSPPSDDVPEGKDDAQNVELRRHGEPRQFGFEIRDHVALAENLGIINVEAAGRIAGTRQYLLFGQGCMLEHAVLRMALDHMVGRGFTPVQVPVMVRYAAMEGTAYFPGGEEQAYKMEKDDLYLIGTSEVPLTSIHAGEILDESQLPLRYVAMSPCFRREAGAAGKDTRGFYRIHQFWKVEQVVIDVADEARSIEHHQAILANSEALVADLELPYRIVNVCGGDLGQGQVQKFDIETWMPSRGDYGETHSASRFHDFQARRLNLRYRDANGKVHFCHTLNNTVVASPRALIPLLENHQQEDGSIAIPKALQPYFGSEVLRPD